MKPTARIHKFVGLSVLAAVLAVSATARPALADTGACMQAMYTAGGGSSTLNCTANDVRIASVKTVVPATDSNGNDISGLFPTGNNTYMCIQGSTINFTATFEVDSNASQRYDIGLYIADGQKSALTGALCNRSILTSANTTPHYDNFTQPPDACGDVSAAHSPYYVTMLVQTTCQGAGNLDLPNCTSWLEKEKKPCTGIADAIPGAPSKCNCGDISTSLVQVVQPSLTVSKNADKTSVDPAGETVTYTVTVQNLSTTMTVNLTNLIESSGTNQSCTGTLTQDFAYNFASSTNPVSVSCGTTTLAPGASTTCTFSRTVSGNPSDKVTDRVCLNGTSAVGAVPPACGCKSISITDVIPTATVDKSVMKAVCATVRYQVSVANTDKWGRQLMLTSLMDSKFGDITTTGQAITATTCQLPTTPLNVGDPPFTCTFDAAVCDTNLPHTNTVTATLAEANSTNTITQTGSATVTGISVSTQ